MHELRKVLKVLAAVALGAWLMSRSQVASAASPHAAAKPATATPAATAPARVVELRVTAKGFEPNPVHVKKGEPLELRITRTTEDTCATEIVIPDAKLQAALPLHQPVSLKFTPSQSGQLKYGCGMGMMVGGVLIVE